MNPLLASMSLFAVLAAQQPVHGRPVQKPAPVSGDRAPVTASEARAVFIRTEHVIRRALKMADVAPAVGIGTGSKPVSRAQIVAEMTREYDMLRPKVKFTPRAVRFNPGVFNMPNAKQKANLAMLVRLGAVARVGPLATNKSDTITAPDFGDAIGFFIARMAEITHQPSSKWTPWLRDVGE